MNARTLLLVSATAVHACAASGRAGAAPAAAPAAATVTLASAPAAPSAAQLEHNKKVVRMIYAEGLSQGRFDLTEPLYAPDFVGHGSTRDFTHEDGLAEAKGWRSAFPDLAMTVDVLLAEGDLVAARWTARGTNTGNGNGLQATGRSVKITGTTVFRLRDGQLVEEWTAADSLGMLRQLGLVPSPPTRPQQGTAGK